jgi:outer membrane receptor protein involved in Fe transport
MDVGRLFLSVVAFLTVSSPALAQVEAVIRGTVVAQADRSALPGATLRLEGSTVTQRLEIRPDSGGQFTFPLITPGDYTLIATHPNFAERRYALTVKPRELQNLVVELKVRPVEQVLDVTAPSGTIQTTHSPSSTMIEAERLEALPLPQRSNLADVIVTAAPGVVRGHDDFVHIRGHEIALNPFINGVSFWENPHVVFSPGVGVDYIESVNVMTGGFSAEYGNRFGGVLDVATKSGFRMNNNGSVTLGVGTALRHNMGVEFGGHTRRLGYYFNVSGLESARFLSPPDPRSIHNTGRAARSFAQVDFAANPTNSMKLVVMGDGANFELPKSERDELLRPDFNNSQRTRSQSTIFSWDHVHSPATLLHSAFYQKRSRVRLLPNPDQFGAKLDASRTLDTVGIKMDLTRFLGRHTVKGGLDLVFLRPNETLYYLSQPWITFTHLPEVNENHIHFRGPNLGSGVPRPVVFTGKRTGGQGSFYLQDKIQLTRNWTADIGLRSDRYSLATANSHFSPRVNLAYRFDSGTTLHGSYNHFFVAPPIENILASSAGLTQLISEIGRPLPPALAIKEDQFELGVVQSVRNVNLGLTGYYRLSDDPPHTVLFPDSRFYAYGSFDKGRAYGIEAKAEVSHIGDTGFSGYLNYAVGRVWFYNPVHAGFITEVAHMNETSKFLAPMDQTHTLTSGITHRHRRSGVWTSLSFEYGSGSPGGHGSGDHEDEPGIPAHEHSPVAGGCGLRCPSHFTQNLSVGWDIPSAADRSRATLQFNVENLSNRVYLISKESTFVQGQYSHPRMFSGSLKFRF